MVIIFTVFILFQGICCASASECTGFSKGLQSQRSLERHGSLSDSISSNTSNNDVMEITQCKGWEIKDSGSSKNIYLEHTHGGKKISFHENNGICICFEAEGNHGKNYAIETVDIKAFIGTCAVVKQKRGSCSSPFGEFYPSFPLMDFKEKSERYCLSRQTISEV